MAAEKKTLTQLFVQICVETLFYMLLSVYRLTHEEAELIYSMETGGRL